MVAAEIVRVPRDHVHSCHTFECVMAHTNLACHTQPLPRDDGHSACHTYACGMAHI